MKSIKKIKHEGFSLIEVLIGIAIVAIALLGLAQLFTYSVMNNSRADRMSNATFLAQQQIDYHRNLTSDELNTLTAGTNDEQIDVNLDGSIDYRRLTTIQATGLFWEIRVFVFSAEQLNTAVNDLIGDPQEYSVKADVSTIISR
ncbi:MAG: prepilin-type N-terminal cleavage/methylation domain-containing protein [Candidatus Aminicenantes bacterium]|nr:MAG: prepilin-type N-terminal cleavage/methylation domain-containing protein [Candidatus Aminicenantes bacterium]